MKVLVTGTEGYLGCLLAPERIRDGHQVVGVDTGFYKRLALQRPGCRSADPGQGSPAHQCRRPRRRRRRRPPGRAVQRPAGPASTEHHLRDQPPRVGRGSRELRQAGGVARFVYTSSCSVYGVAGGEVDETVAESTRRPPTRRARSSSSATGALADDDFSPTFLRNATAYGASPRMRFDIVLNNLCRPRLDDQKISMDERRHAVAAAGPRASTSRRRSARARRAPRSRCTDEIFNVGDAARITGCARSPRSSARRSRAARSASATAGGDNRSYRVSFDKIRERAARLPLPLGRAAWRGGTARRVRAHRDG